MKIDVAKASFLIFAFLLLPLSVPTSRAATMAGNIDGVVQNGQTFSLSGWACEVGSQASVTVHIYADGPYGSGGNLIAYGIANASSEPGVASACETTGSSYRFLIPIPASALQHFPGALYAYGISADANMLIGNSGRDGIPLIGIGNETIDLGSSGQGWSVDPADYFSAWKCVSGAGLSHIRRLNILPSTKLAPAQWKDSLVAGPIAQASDGNPVLFFTFGDMGSTMIFGLVKAKYDASAGSWKIYQYLADPDSVSSHAGTETDFIYNKYHTDGWGPFTITSGLIPGVDNTGELWGSGPLGLSTLRSASQPYQSYDSNTHSCLMMNPSLFDYDTNGTPHSFIATMWTEQWETTTSHSPAGCIVPAGTPGAVVVNGVSTLPPGPYVFRYGASSGWQLDASVGLVENQQGLDYAMNADPIENNSFIRADWSGKLMRITPPSMIASSVLDCSGSGAVHFSEASRGPNGSYYFLVDELPGSNARLAPQHDIFVAF